VADRDGRAEDDDWYHPDDDADEVGYDDADDDGADVEDHDSQGHAWDTDAWEDD
jgi:hypothetical protein